MDEKPTIQHGERTTSTTGLVTVREVFASPIQQFEGVFGSKEKSYTGSFDNYQKKSYIEEEEEEEEEEEDDDDANAVSEDFVPPKYLPQNPDARSTPSPALPLRMQKVYFSKFSSIKKRTSFSFLC